LRGKFSHRPRNDPALYDGPFPFIQTGDVARSKKYIKEYSQTLNEKGFCVSKQFPKHTLVMTIAANIGDVAILNFDACFPDSIVGLVPFKEINLDFLYLVLTSMKPELLKQAPVNTQGNLNVERIGSLKIAIPTIHEQLELVKQIEEKTQVIDSLVEKNLSTIELAQEYRTRLISDVVTGQIDVRDIEISNIVEGELIEETFEEEQEEESLEFVGAGDDD
jgi:type I restriction enzyme S subunit